jgi:hypothetical protein
MVTQGDLGRRCREHRDHQTVLQAEMTRRDDTYMSRPRIDPGNNESGVGSCNHGTSSIIRVQISVYALGFHKVEVLLWSLVPGVGKPYPMIADTKNGGEGRGCAAFSGPISVSCSIFPGFIVLQISLILGHTERTRDRMCSLRRRAETKPGTILWPIPPWD